MTRARWTLGLACMIAAIVAAVPSVRAAVTEFAVQDETRFPHAKHAGLFPSCVGCHGGVLAGDSVSTPLMGTRGTSLYPEPSQCAGCHDGAVQPRVEWDAPRRAGSNLRFSHAEHNREADLGEPALNCGQCHQQGGATAFMAVARARPEPCVACHGHQAPSHLADASPCRTCHVPVARAVALTAAQVGGFSRPPSHDDPAFISNHAPDPAAQARCAVCHARESCERCHVNAAAVPQIAALERDPRIAQIAGALPPSYPAPASHRDADWTYAHGEEAVSTISRCANCHTQPGCLACHTGPLGGRTIARLPAGSPKGRGVELRHEPEAPPTVPPLGGPHAATSDGDVVLQGGTAPPRRTAVSSQDTTPRDTTRRVAARPDTAKRVRVHPPGFARTHGPAAAAERLSCAGCHQAKRFCTDCHDGESKRRYHPANFVARHPADAYARQTECASCHSREGFCGACHQRAGLQSQGRLGVAYHTAQPLWLIQHARAARQGLESCTTCHVQRDCLQCHAVTGWGVNPHGPGFDARRMADRNAQTCRACHVGDPFANRP